MAAASKLTRMRGPILITGADGFVGGHLVAELGGDAVAGLTDVLDAEAFAAELRGVRPAAVIHLAALSSVGDSWEGVAEVWRTNVVGTVQVLESVRAEAPEARVLVASSGEVYGRAETIPTPEDSPFAPGSPYAASKAAAELAASQAAARGQDVVVVRPFPQVGPGQDERFAIGSWTRQIARLEADGGGTMLVGDLSGERDLTDVRDGARAYRLLLEADAAPGAYNLASGRGVRMADVLDLLVGLSSVPIEVEQEEARLRPADIPVLVGDPSKLRAATGWEPAIQLEQTLADALEAARRIEVGVS
jgi:GDP-4-dehydro-6-deoxy-D-mannose reductase